MKDTRGPDSSIPDSVPDELVRIYGAEARSAVRARRSRRFRLSARLRGWIGAHDRWYLVATAALWLVILAGFGGALVVAVSRWPAPTLDAGIVVSVAAVSSVVTAAVLRRRGTRAGR